eukprot:TRINITY_DN13361_c0_g1_i7.p1 TRINITY_DN13361_c0_g1~~TRINITY_DN13361_c0_g1_i7.p1  ORF type:complete len:589 (-),score=236.37 TRINITY_DN13361_c0_g1_i7:80-1846(-)
MNIVLVPIDPSSAPLVPPPPSLAHRMSISVESKEEKKVPVLTVAPVQVMPAAAPVDDLPDLVPATQQGRPVRQLRRGQTLSNFAKMMKQKQEEKELADKKAAEDAAAAAIAAAEAEAREAEERAIALLKSRPTLTHLICQKLFPDPLPYNDEVFLGTQHLHTFNAQNNAAPTGTCTLSVTILELLLATPPGRLGLMRMHLFFDNDVSGGISTRYARLDKDLLVWNEIRRLKFDTKKPPSYLILRLLGREDDGSDLSTLRVPTEDPSPNETVIGQLAFDPRHIPEAPHSTWRWEYLYSPTEKPQAVAHIQLDLSRQTDRVEPKKVKARPPSSEQIEGLVSISLDEGFLLDEVLLAKRQRLRMLDLNLLSLTAVITLGHHVLQTIPIKGIKTPMWNQEFAVWIAEQTSSLNRLNLGITLYLHIDSQNYTARDILGHWNLSSSLASAPTPPESAEDAQLPPFFPQPFLDLPAFWHASSQKHFLIDCPLVSPEGALAARLKIRLTTRSAKRLEQHHIAEKMHLFSTAASSGVDQYVAYPEIEQVLQSFHLSNTDFVQKLNELQPLAPVVDLDQVKRFRSVHLERALVCGDSQ